MEFNKENSKTLIKQYKGLIARLNKQLSYYKGLDININKALELLKGYVLNKRLSLIPIDLLNRNKIGIKIKVLKENRIRTILDVSKYGYQSLCSLNGIGPTNANKIINEAREIISEERERVKISFNDRSSYSDNLLLLIYIKLELKDKLDIITKYNNSYRVSIINNNKALRKRTNPLKWLFTLKSGRAKIEDSFNKLAKHLSSDDYVGVNEAINKALAIKEINSDVVYEDYKNSPNRYLDFVKKINSKIIDNDDYKRVVVDNEEDEIDPSRLPNLEKLLSGVIDD